jgi:Domain of unknown function (DUF4928)
MPLSEMQKSALSAFRVTARISGKGALAVVVHVTRLAVEKGLPLDESELVTEGEGQVLGLGKGAVQKVLAEHGVLQLLAEEGGRTSRGSIRTMRAYVQVLNDMFRSVNEALDLRAVEVWWIEKVKEHFAAKPFKLRFDGSKTLHAIVQTLLAQAKKRQSEGTGTMFQGIMLQHLVGAKLELALPELQIRHNGASVADHPTDRAGDFSIEDSVLHVTTAPSEALFRKCQRNIDADLRPLILTLGDGVAASRTLANNAGLEGRIEILDAEQFIAANIHELTLFASAKRRATIVALVETYNRIVSTCENDPSLMIELG